MLCIIDKPALAERTTLRLGGKALAELVLDEAADCYKLSSTLAALGGSPLVLGVGSNILADDGPLPLVLVRPRFRSLPRVVEENGDTVQVRVGANVSLPRLLGFCAAQGLAGLQGLCGIPGSVGGAVAMNAGSFGCETCAALQSLRIYSPALGIADISADYMRFDYRHFKIAGLTDWFLIVSATFGLTRSTRNGINQDMRRNFLKKKSTQPVGAWSAGCVFKNPSLTQPAGMLLEQAGFKGKEKGGMIFSPVHANFLVNQGKGSATAALDLVYEAQEAVRRRFGVTLEPEVRILTCRAR